MITVVLLVFVAFAAPPNVAAIDLPPAPHGPFVFGPGDRLEIRVHRHQDLDGPITVAPDGTITVPLVGRVVVGGKSYEAVVSSIETGLREYYTDASVAVNVVEINNRKVFVVGEVKTPSVLQITGEMRALEALVQSGGINPDARTSNVLLVRGGLDKPVLATIDVDALMRGDTAQNVALRPDDILVVPAKTIVNVERFFRRIQGILSPFVSASQIYRNVALTRANQPIIEDQTPQ
jgi:protein involved in polysaccharide export with SLBB domain